LFALVLWVFPNSMVLQGTAGTLAVFAPAIAAVIAGGLGEPARAGGDRRARWAVFIVTWILAWASLILFVWKVREVPVNGPLLAFGAVLAMLPAFVASRAFSGITGVRENFRSLVVPRGGVLWYLAAVFAFPAVQIAGAMATRVLHAGGLSQPGPSITVDPIAAIALFLNGFFFAGGINEESGWRGFAFRKLQGNHCPLVAALIVWVFWALWHLPTDLTSGAPASSILLNRTLFNAMWSILFVWLFNRTKGSLLAPALAHPAMNASGSLLPRTGAATVLFALLVLFAIVSDRMWRRIPGAKTADSSA
jgi:membrane protease YdiL (CAAX protease family)